ncbi:MAG: hypothetical protein WC977_14640 [Anaerovoracaceae bacterium]|jgi:hypothetical protein
MSIPGKPPIPVDPNDPLAQECREVLAPLRESGATPIELVEAAIDFFYKKYLEKKESGQI